MSLLRVPRFVALVALVSALFVSVGIAPVSAAGPTLSANPTQVAFDPTPGKAGTTHLTAISNDQASYAVCVSDNGGNPIRIQDVVNTTTASVAFPFIQAGSYRFFLAIAGSCTNEIAGTSVTVQRKGPKGLVGVDDLQVTPVGDQLVDYETQFPLSGQVCFMSGNGAQKSLDLLYRQDIRPLFSTPGGGGLTNNRGFEQPVATTITSAVLGQNGCYPFNAIVNGYYQFNLGDKQAFIGFCTIPDGDTLAYQAGFAPNRLGACNHFGFIASADISTDALSFENRQLAPAGTVINGAIVTGANAHAVQVCASAFTPTGGTDVKTLVSGATNAYNRSGATRLTPLPMSGAAGTVWHITTYDLNKPDGPGGMGAAQAVCPTEAATAAGGAITAVTTPALTNAVARNNCWFQIT